MSKPRTAIRRMWNYNGTLCSPHSRETAIGYTDEPGWKAATQVLVIPDNPAARAAMVDRAASVYKGFHRETIEDIINIALDGVDEAVRKSVEREAK